MAASRSCIACLAALCVAFLGACSSANTFHAPAAAPSANAREAQRLEGVARTASSDGRYQDAARAYEDYLEALAKDETRDPAAYANGLTQLGGCYYRLRFFAQAAASYREAIAFESARLGADHEDVEGLLSILAGVELRLNRPQEAERIQRQLLDSEHRKHARGRRESATILTNLAEALQAQGRHEEAERCRQEAKDIRHKLCDEC
jgi:tetratricopeptide (TPR) repeat protein